MGGGLDGLRQGVQPESVFTVCRWSQSAGESPRTNCSSRALLGMLKTGSTCFLRRLGQSCYRQCSQCGSRCRDFGVDQTAWVKKGAGIKTDDVKCNFSCGAVVAVGGVPPESCEFLFLDDGMGREERLGER